MSASEMDWRDIINVSVLEERDLKEGNYILCYRQLKTYVTLKPCEIGLGNAHSSKFIL